MSQMKNGGHQELFDFISNDKRFQLVYSTSHISDLYNSFSDKNKLGQIEGDLDYIAQLTDCFCLSNSGKEVSFNYHDPKDLFFERVDQRGELDDLSFENLFDFGEDSALKDLSGLYKNMLKSIPIDREINEALNNPDYKETIDKILPDFSNSKSIEGIFDSFGKMLKSLNKGEGYKDLRNIAQSGLKINRDKIFDSDNPFDDIKKHYSKLNIVNPLENIVNDKNAPAWYNEISNNYILLDMHGYQEDRVRVDKGRKETYENTTEDAFHAAFGSTCNFYILNDKRAYKKTCKVYEHLNLSTVVLRPDDFVKYYDLFLKPRDFKTELLLLPEILKSETPINEKKVEEKTIFTYWVRYFLFDFFDKVDVLVGEQNKVDLIVFSQFHPTNKGITFHSEIELLADKLLKVFGVDDENIEKVDAEQLENSKWQGLKWTLENNVVYTFQRMRNGKYCMTMEIN